MSAQRMKMFAGVVLGPRSETVAFTVAELKAFCLERLHTRQKLRTLDWAHDEEGFLDDFGLKVKATASAYKKAIEKLLCAPAVGKNSAGKPGAKGGKGHPRSSSSSLGTNATSWESNSRRGSQRTSRDFSPRCARVSIPWMPDYVTVPVPRAHQGAYGSCITTGCHIYMWHP